MSISPKQLHQRLGHVQFGSACEHKHFLTQNHVARQIDPIHHKVELVYVARIWCRDCRVEFAFRGLAGNEPGPNAPFVAQWGTTLRAPLEPALLAPLYGQKPNEGNDGQDTAGTA